MQKTWPGWAQAVFLKNHLFNLVNITVLTCSPSFPSLPLKPGGPCCPWKISYVVVLKPALNTLKGIKTSLLYTFIAFGAFFVCIYHYITLHRLHEKCIQEALHDHMTAATLKGRNNSMLLHENRYKSQGETGYHYSAFQHGCKASIHVLTSSPGGPEAPGAPGSPWSPYYTMNTNVTPILWCYKIETHVNPIINLNCPDPGWESCQLDTGNTVHLISNFLLVKTYLCTIASLFLLKQLDYSLSISIKWYLFLFSINFELVV